MWKLMVLDKRALPLIEEDAVDAVDGRSRGEPGTNPWERGGWRAPPPAAATAAAVFLPWLALRRRGVLEASPVVGGVPERRGSKLALLPRGEGAPSLGLARAPADGCLWPEGERWRARCDAARVMAGGLVAASTAPLPRTLLSKDREGLLVTCPPPEDGRRGVLPGEPPCAFDRRR
mmetsp:Transcript_17260/g.50298  ORF Transcript_17260/g.50298 Transcript_17260/m.50298 type:complete len:176 (-) Transcript_17260:1135-1662(-)